MSNIYQGTGADDMPTAPYRVPGTAPGGMGPGKGGGKGTWSRGKRAAALLGVCAAVGGGTFAVVQSTTGAPAATQAAATQTGTQASLTAQASALRDVVTTTGPRRLARLRHLGGMYGQYTYETKTGPRTLAFERGTVTSVGGGDVEVRATDGTTWKWVLTGTSVIRENGTKEPQATLAAGQAVLAAGPVTSGTRDARLIVIRKAGTGPKASRTA